MPSSVSIQGIIELNLENLREPAFYEVLFGASPVIEQDILPDKILQVRLLNPKTQVYEIITGVEQFRAARRHDIQTVAAVVKEMDDDQARRWATDEFLRAAASTAARSVVQLLVAAKDNEAYGGDWGVDRLTKLLRIKKSTYTHAWSCISFVCEELRRSDPEAASLGLAELVASAVRSNFIPEFTALYLGRISVNKFYSQVYQASELGKERSRQQRDAKGRSKLQSGRDRSRLADNAGADMTTSALPSIRPDQLIAEAITKLAQATAVGDGGDHDGGEQSLDQQIATVLESHSNLEPAIRLICRKLFKHLDTSRTRHSRSKSTRSAQPIRLDDARQLSFDLPASDRADGHNSDRDRDDAAHAALTPDQSYSAKRLSTHQYKHEARAK
jgi:hypothetical protein